MSRRPFGHRLAMLLVTCVLAGGAHAMPTSFEFAFTGDCDDCAFAGNPGDPGFDPLLDNLTETVTATLSLTGVSVNADGIIEFLGAGSAVFSYHGSSLINPFTMHDPYLFTTSLSTSGTVQPGTVFSFASTQNVSDPANPLSFEFPDFCTALGEQVLGGDCFGVGDVTFELDEAGGWTVFGIAASDVGTGGQFVPVPASAAPAPSSAALMGLALLGLGAAARRRAVARGR